MIYEFIILYVLLFLMDYFVLKKLNVLDEYNFIKHLCHIKKKIKVTYKLKLISSLINSVILSVVCVFAINVKISLLILFPLVFLLLLALIYSLYTIYGNFLKKYIEKSKLKH